MMFSKPLTVRSTLNFIQFDQDRGPAASMADMASSLNIVIYFIIYFY